MRRTAPAATWTRSLRLLLCSVVMSVALPVGIPAMAAAGDDSGGYVTQGPSQSQVIEVDGVRHYESTASVSVQPGNGSSREQLSSTANDAGYDVEFTNVLSANDGPAERVRFYYAHTKRLSGSGPYWAEAHAVLIEGAAYDGNQVFNYKTDSCAAVSAVNAMARTCGSPWFDTSPGDQWLVISGHSYDDGNDGSVEIVIAGERDWVWTAPSS